MKFSIDKLELQSYNGPYEFEQTIEIPEITEKNPEIKKISPVIVSGLCTIDKDEYIFTFTMKGNVILPCARTLVDVDVPFEYNGTEIYTTKDYLTAEDEEDEIHSIDGYLIDLRPQIIEQIILQLPYRVFSDEAVLEEGKGWNYFTEAEQAATEAEKSEEIDPRFSKLKQLLEKEQDE